MVIKIIFFRYINADYGFLFQVYPAEDRLKYKDTLYDT